MTGELEDPQRMPGAPPSQPIDSSGYDPTGPAPSTEMQGSRATSAFRRLAIGESALVPWLERQLGSREWKQADLARGLGVSTGMVSNWLTGQRRVSPYYCERIAALLGADVDHLLALAGHRPMVLSTDPDEPVEQLVSKLRRVDLSDARYDALSDILEGMLARDRVEARGRQLVLPGTLAPEYARDADG